QKDNCVMETKSSADIHSIVNRNRLHGSNNNKTIIVIMAITSLNNRFGSLVSLCPDPSSSSTTGK
ncbi:MAG: hypothetical protein WCF23_03650, partial [Candidatus Nitrosopolaris sp.]